MTTTSRRTTPKKTPDEAIASNGEVFDATALLEEIKADGRWFDLHGEQFFLPVPTAWPDAAFKSAQAGDVAETARHILGDDYERFVGVGGNGVFLQQLVEKLHGASLGESSGSSPS